MWRLRLAAAIATLAPALAAPARAEGDAVPGTGDVPPEAVLAELAFEAQGELNRVYLDLAPEGHRPFVWLLDTGAQGSVMTPRAARAAGVSVRRVKSSPYVRDTRLGRAVRFWVDDRHSDTASDTGWEFRLLGGDFLREYVVEIDFPARRVRFLDAHRFSVSESEVGPGEAVLPMRVFGNRPFVEVEVAGRKTRVLLDTGAPDNLVLSGKAARKLGIDWKALPDFGRYGSTVGPVEVRLHETGAFRFGGYDFGLLPVVVAPRGWYNIGGNTDSTVGFDVLRQFVVRLDYPREKIWLKRTGDPRPTYLGVDYALTRKAGVFLLNSFEGPVVVGIRPESPAAALGLQPGDRPVSPEGEGALDVEDFLARVAEQSEVTVAREADGLWIDRVLPDPGAVAGGEGASEGD